VNLLSGESNEDNMRTTGPIVVDEIVQALIPYIVGGTEGLERLAQEFDALELSAATRLKSTIAGSLARELRGEARALRLGAWTR
jgi:hypothetical protein